jgi:hypothetical protein
MFTQKSDYSIAMLVALTVALAVIFGTMFHAINEMRIFW